MSVPDAVGGRVRLAFEQFVADPAYPCLGARSALRRGGCQVAVYGAMNADSTTTALARDLAGFSSVAESLATSPEFATFAAIFVQPAPADERRFETALWEQLTRLASVDSAVRRTHTASDDPDDPAFAFGFAGSDYFVIGMHAESSRLARRFGWPTLVFNPHAQFARLRAEQRFERLRETIRHRDVALQGDINPNLADAGEVSEARQYSGRVTEPSWRCPFHRPAS